MLDFWLREGRLGVNLFLVVCFALVCLCFPHMRLQFVKIRRTPTFCPVSAYLCVLFVGCYAKEAMLVILLFVVFILHVLRDRKSVV